MVDIYSQLFTMTVDKSLLEAARQTLSFSYGGLKLVFHCANQVIPWDVIEEFTQTMKKRLAVGLAGLYQVSIYTTKGFLITGVFYLGANVVKMDLSNDPVIQEIAQWLKQNLIF